MMKLLAFILALSITSPSWGAFAEVASVNCGLNASGCTTSGINTTGANLLIAAIGCYSYTPSNSSQFYDSKSNNWTFLTEKMSGSGTGSRLIYTVPTSVGSGHTFTAVGGYCSVEVIAFSGASETPFDAENGNNGGTASTLQPGSVSPAESGELVVTGVGTGSDHSGYSIDSSFVFSSAGNKSYTVGAYMGSGIAWKESSSAENPTWDFGSSCNASGVIAAFKGSGAGPAAQPVCPSPFCGIIQ